MDREPAVAGQFYVSDKAKLASAVDKYLENVKLHKNEVEGALSYVAPHAGYDYSGQVEAFTYKAISMKKNLESMDTFVIVGPNHTGFGYPTSISARNWKTPLGTVENDIELSTEIASSSGMFTIDESAHRFEHSIEVQLPFLQKTVKDPRCCFICMGDQSFEYSRLLASAIARGAEKLGRKITVIASSDFNHYESAKVAESKDMPAIEALKKLDFPEFNRRIKELDDSACGYGPITVSGMFAKGAGAQSGTLLKYANSGDITKDYKSVVAYSSIVFV